MKKLIILFLSVVVLYSCEKHPDEIKVTINQQGKLKIKVVDNEGKPVEGSIVSFMVGYTNISIDETKTDENGIGTIELLEGNYYYEVLAERNKTQYRVSDLVVQVIAGKEKTLEINAFENTGILDLSLFIISGPKKSGLNVALVPAFFREYTTVDEIKDSAHFIGKTDNVNFVRFKDIPTYKYYNVYVYDDNNYIYHSYQETVYSYKGEKNSVHIDIWGY